MPWRHCIFTDTGVVFPPCPPLKTQPSRPCGSGSGPHLKDKPSRDILESLEQMELTDATASAATTPIAALERAPLHAKLGSGPVKRLRTSLPQEEALTNNAEQGKDTFIRRATTLETLGHQASSSRSTSPIWRLAATIARRGQSLPTKLESPLGAAALWHGRQSEPTSQLDSSARGRRPTMLTLSSASPWKVMGRRWKTAKFVQAHNELAARRGAHLATTTTPPRTQSSTLALQEYFRTQVAPPPDATRRTPAPHRACACFTASPRHPLPRHSPFSLA